jgi:predicted RNA-binding Zn-ribbon protein involved in translation (DUF1610 family)
MMSPNAESLLRVWEENHGAHPIRRALALLEAAAPGVAAGDWAAAPIGRRDGRLLELYEILFGPQLHSVANCPRCGEVLETSFTTRDLSMSAVQPSIPCWIEFRERGMCIRYRLPNSDDLLHVMAATNDPEEAQIQLLRRCVIEAKQADKRQQPEQLPAEVVDRFVEEMAQQDPGADVQIQLECPSCGYVWSVCFDIVSYFWSGLSDWAQRTLAEVHLLARAYGWSEREILGLSATRRQQYVEMVQA